MQISPDRPPKDLCYIHSYTTRGFVVKGETHEGPVLVCAEQVRPWRCDLERLPPDWAEADLMACEGELLLIGTGDRLRFLPHRLYLALLERFAGVEVMTTEAACRTYDVTVLEGRRVMAALMCPRAPQRSAHGN